MNRIKNKARTNWIQEVEKIGFGFHTLEGTYWDESVYYEFEMDEILEIEKASAELYEMCLEAVQFVIDQKLYDIFQIPEFIIPEIERSWNEDDCSIYGRFDFCYKNGQIKMLEFNADTPTSLYEASIVQWYWLESLNNKCDQFNSIHEKLINYWNYLKRYIGDRTLYFACVKDNLEDFTTVEYLRDCAMQGGLNTKFIYINDIGYDEERCEFVDLDEESIDLIFKLYPWEWMINEDFGDFIVDSKTEWIEPAWKMILSNKAILPILWKLYPEHPYLLRSEFGRSDMKNYVKKPLLSREGSNIEIYIDGAVLERTGGEYGEEGYIFQELFELPEYEGNYPVIGSWIIGGESAGIGIRENCSLITNNLSRFIPHLIK